MRKKLRFTTGILAAIMSFSLLFTGCTGDAQSQGDAQNDNTPGQSASAGTGSNNPAGQTSMPEPTPEPVPTPSPTPEPPKRPDFTGIKARAVYLTGWSAGSSAKIQNIIDMSKTTELNAVVIDIKDDDGKVGYETNISAVREIGAWEKKYDVDSAIKALHENNIYVIGRLVCFKDPILAQKRPDLAYKSKNGGVWKDWNGMPWINPANKEAWDYNLEIAREAIEKGFDEIQYDYVRYSNDGNTSLIDYGPDFDSSMKSDIIAEFLDKSMSIIKDELKTPLSADVFGIAAVSTADDKILGQNWEKLASEVDYLCPMVYPSHYANTRQNGVGQGINGVNFAKPDLDPYNVIYQTLLAGKKRLETVEPKAKMRPYLQAFTAPWLGQGYYQKYGAQQVREQIKAVYDAGYEEWILWDPNNVYPSSYFEAK